MSSGSLPVITGWPFLGAIDRQAVEKQEVVFARNSGQDEYQSDEYNRRSHFVVLEVSFTVDEAALPSIQTRERC